MRPKSVWVVLLLCTAIAFGAFAYPMYVIRPFRQQGTAELLAALFVKRWAPFVSIAAAVCAIACIGILWRSARSMWIRVASAFATLVTVVSAGLTHVNVYEMMFHRVDTPEAMPASEAKLDLDEMVLSIRVGETARAYPIRMMGYHHIVNDRIGATPIAATY
jgi:hypothetical protein